MTTQRYTHTDGHQATVHIDPRGRVLITLATLHELLTHAGWTPQGKSTQ